jgi:hypothetical protein
MALLLLVGSLPTRIDAARWAGLALILGGFILGVFGVRWAIARLDLIAPTDISRVALASDRIAAKRVKQTIVVIDGGSHTARGVDGALLTKELARLGHDVTVFQLSVKGANHFERRLLHERLRDVLGSLPGIEKHRVVLMLEVEAGYDTYPLYQLDENANTDRAYAYLSPEVAYDAWRAIRRSDGVFKGEGLEKALLSHAAINGLNVGASVRLVDASVIKRGAGYSPAQGAKKRFAFPGVGEAKKAFAGPAGPDVRWLRRARDGWLRREWDGLEDQRIYFAPPSLAGNYTTHARGFCSRTKVPCFPGDAALLARLDKRHRWRDKGHLSEAGAKIYTRYLAGELARNKAVWK